MLSKAVFIGIPIGSAVQKISYPASQFFIFFKKILAFQSGGIILPGGKVIFRIMKLFRTILTVFLILLTGGSFFLHHLVHHSVCCGSGTQLSAHADSGICVIEVSCTDDSAEFFCPVCAGMLTADQVSTENHLTIPFGQGAAFTALSELLSTPDWLRPSPRGPPTAIPAHFG